jgi:triacylglycerol lipase
MDGPVWWLKRATARFRALTGGRRISIAALAVLVAVAGAAAAIAAAGGSGGPARAAGARSAGRSPATSPPAAPGHTAPAPAASPALPAQDQPGPVLLVPGYGGGTGALDELAAAIRAAGRAAIVVHLPGSGTGSLIPDAARLNAAVRRALARGAPSVDVVGYSAGGVVALLWARTDDGVATARRIITLGSPFHGTELAAAARSLVPDACPAACRQLVPGSSLLAGLDVASPAGLPPWLSLWTTDDLVVVPVDSARLAGAINVPLQTLCPARIVSHSQLPTDPAVIAIVLRALGRGPLAQPSASTCHG